MVEMIGSDCMRRPGTAGFVAVTHVQHTDPRDVRENPLTGDSKVAGYFIWALVLREKQSPPSDRVRP
jgi:hypothetical protein